MQSKVLYQPSYSLLIVALDEGESVLAEAGAMVSMTSNIQMQTASRGGILQGLKRSVLGGESFFINTFTCGARQGEITFAPSLPGDIMHIPMSGGTMYLQSGAYIVGTSGIQVDTSWAGAKGFFSGAGLFLLKCSGQGDLFVSSYGAIHALDLQVGQEYVVDTGHIVAFDETVTWNVRTAGGIKQTLFSGEGLVCAFTGPGRLYLQTRSFDAFLGFLIPKLPKRD
jgi:uncharacterized protein (TIGR00266 family)